ncbi:MAG: hypothetical protein JNK25_02060 [Phycisphaerae bacterium]|nr:hypothetical protein [Phycisphaerae bacterium]
MKPLKLMCLAGLILLPMQTASAAAMEFRPQPLYRVKPSERNAALKYWEASAGMSRELSTALGELNYEEIGMTPESAEKNEAWKAALKAAGGSNAGEWLHASGYTRCDFEVRYEDGVGALLPHLGKLRSGARLLRFEARRAIIEGRPDDAARYLAALIRIGNHVCGDGFLISSLVGNAIVSMSMAEIREYAESGRMTASARESIQRGLDQIDEKDPMRIRAALVGEQTIMLDWIRVACTGPEAGAKLASLLFEVQNQDDQGLTEVNRAIIEKLDESGLAREVVQTEKAYQAMLDAWDSEDPDEACKAVAERMKRHEFGPLAAEICPSVARSRFVASRFEKDLKETRASLDTAKIAEPAEVE